MNFEAVVYGEAWGLNKLIRAHYRAYGKYRDNIIVQLRAQKPRGFVTLEKARVKIVTVRKTRFKDADNLGAVSKAFNDALTRNRIIFDDSVDVIGAAVVEQLTLKQGGVKRPETRIYVTGIKTLED